MIWIQEFVRENIWLCVIIGVVIWIVLSEVFGLSQRVFGGRDDYTEPREHPTPEMERAARQAQQDFPDEEDKVSFDDFLGSGGRDDEGRDDDRR